MPLYKHFYHGLKYEDQLSVVLFPPGSELVAISLARDCRSFTERDRRLLNLLRPHLARAYRHVERIALLKRTLGAGPAAAQDTRVTSVLLDAHDRPVQFGAEAQRWIDHFFPDRARDASRLPEVVTAWLRHGGTAGQRHPKLSRESDSLVRERDGQVLRLRVIPALSGPGRILVLGLEVAPAAAARALGAEGLTRREIEVLLQVEEGKTNDEAAAALGISPLTVRTHLEHIFEKLRVPSRTAAVTQFRRLCSRLSTAWVGIVIQIFGGDPAAAALILASL
jgi:DNA-binding CsgD family transcriptional regulator